MGKGSLIYEEMCKHLVIYEEAVATVSFLNFLIYEENLIFFFYQCIDYIVFSCNHREVKNSIVSAQTGLGLAWRRPKNERPVEKEAENDLAYDISDMSEPSGAAYWWIFATTVSQAMKVIT
jgi:hypothetical protein